MNPSLRVFWLLTSISAAALLACNPPKLDQDGDGFTELTGDCDDLDANVHPEAQEVCYNGIDDNCNGVEDEEGATSGRVWYQDYDGDGYGKEDLTVLACDQPEGYAAEKWDCQEDNADIHPGAIEVCDAVDNDCDGEIDETTSADAMTWYPDGDGDGYGDPERVVTACASPGEGWLSDGSDCNDDDPLVSPEQTESCYTDYDDDCDGLTDAPDAFGCIDYYADLDGDGVAGTAACLCSPDEVYRETTGPDCDDTDPAVFPDNGLDDAGWSDRNCDGTVERTLSDAEIILEVSDISLLSDSTIRMHSFGAGDLNGDGHSDPILGLTVPSQYNSGAVLVASGATLGDAHAIQEAPLARIEPLDDGLQGGSIDYGITTLRPLAHDLNEDGIDDLILSQWVDDAGVDQTELAVFLGPVSGMLDTSEADSTFIVPVAQQARHGPRLLSNPGTGGVRLAVGDSKRNGSFATTSGAVHYIEWDDGLVAGGRRDGLVAGQQLGDAFVSAGDFDGDGIDDHLIGSNSTYGSELFGAIRSPLGRVLEVFTDDGLEPSVSIVSSAYYTNIYTVLGGPGDLNGDGHPDLVFSTESNIYARQSGRTHVVWGPLDGVVELVRTPQVMIHGAFALQQLVHPSVVSDTTGDGRDDLLLSAYYSNARGDGTPRGTTYLWPGQDLDGVVAAGEDMVTIDNGYAGKTYSAPGWSSYRSRPAGGVGDVDADGLEDILIRGMLSVEDDPDSLDHLFIFLGGAQ